MVGLPISGGALLAELSMEPSIIKFSTNRNLVNRLLPYSMILLGWYFMSYPKQRPEWQPWSNSLWNMGMLIFPNGSEIYSFWNIIGVLLVTFGIILSSTLQRMLSHPSILWLGAHSFPIYLIHGPLLRSFFNWILYAFTKPVWYDEKDENDVITRSWARFPLPTAWKFFVLLPVYYVVLFWLADLWMKSIESQCSIATKWLEDTVSGVKHERFFNEISLQADGRNNAQKDRSGATTPNVTLLPT
jgi:hypothetical protein